MLGWNILHNAVRRITMSKSFLLTDLYPDCGTAIASTGAVATISDCSMACAGNSSEACGGPNRLNLFWNGKNPPPGPSTDPGSSNYGFLGCYT